MKHLRRFLLIALASLVLAVASGQPVRAGSAANSLSRAQAAIEAVATIPVRLPTEVPLNSPAAPEPGSVWAEAAIARPDQYEMLYNRAEDCTGVEACIFALARGYRLSALEFVLNLSGFEAIQLANDTQAYFKASRENTEDPAIVAFEENDIRYEFWIYMADKEDVVAMANSAIH